MLQTSAEFSNCSVQTDTRSSHILIMQISRFQHMSSCLAEISPFIFSSLFSFFSCKRARIHPAPKTAAQTASLHAGLTMTTEDKVHLETQNKPALQFKSDQSQKKHSPRWVCDIRSANAVALVLALRVVLLALVLAVTDLPPGWDEVDEAEDEVDEPWMTRLNQCSTAGWLWL